MFKHFSQVRRFFVAELNNPLSRYSRSYLESVIGAVDILITEHYRSQETVKR